MAWQIVGFIHPGQVFNGKKWVDQHGPLPARLWVKSPTDKRHRVARPSRLVGRVSRTRRDYERQAVIYCAWLAKRDGFDLPASAYGKPVWVGKHIRAVEFSREFSFLIPNWDFEPQEPVEEIIQCGDTLVEWLNLALAA